MKNLESLVEQYKQNPRNLRVEQKLHKELLKIAKSKCWRYLRTSIHPDLVQECLICGFRKALDYDPSRKVPFKVYIGIHMAGKVQYYVHKTFGEFSGMFKSTERRPYLSAYLSLHDKDSSKELEQLAEDRGLDADMLAQYASFLGHNAERCIDDSNDFCSVDNPETLAAAAEMIESCHQNHLEDFIRCNEVGNYKASRGDRLTGYGTVKYLMYEAFDIPWPYKMARYTNYDE